MDLKTIATTTSLLLGASLTQAEGNLSMFPKPEKNEVRHVIWLKPLKQESHYKVQLVIGQQKKIDCNNHRLVGQLQKKTAQGWGYNYYKFESSARSISTKMGCLGRPKVSRFVTAHLPNGFLRYNSKLPIVVYTPKGMTVKYQYWSTNNQLATAPEG